MNEILLKNERYSYESEGVLKIDSLSPYDTDYLENLKIKYQLEKVVSNAKSDFEKILKITKWISNLWQHDGNNTPQKYDPISILDEVVENGQRFRCVEYGVVIYGCLTALGLPSRKLCLKTSDVETREYGAGHVVTEVFLKDINKWVFIDGQWGIIPTLGGTPLNGVELAQALNELEKYRDQLKLISLKSQNTKDEEYYKWIKEYLFFFDFTYWQNENGAMLPKNIMLTPIGAKKPAVFQIIYPLQIDTFTHSAIDFYQRITKS
jgi:hypothetical protein